MPRCTVDLSDYGLCRQIAKLEKKFRNLQADLQRLARSLESDYQDARIHPVHITMRGLGDSTYEVWKFDIASTDLKKHQRECLRLIGVFLDLTATPRCLTGIIVYHKSGHEGVDVKEIVAEVKRLRSTAKSASA